MKRSIFWATAVVLLSFALASLNSIVNTGAQTPSRPGSREYQHGVFFADSLQSIVTGNVGASTSTGFILGNKKVFKIVGTGKDTSEVIPAVNAWLLGYAEGITSIGSTHTSGTAAVAVWLQGANVPIPYKTAQWKDLALVDSLNGAAGAYDNAVGYKIGKGLIRGVAPDTVGRGVAWWRFRFSGNGASTDTVSVVFVPVIMYPESPMFK